MSKTDGPVPPPPEAVTSADPGPDTLPEPPPLPRERAAQAARQATPPPPPPPPQATDHEAPRPEGVGDPPSGDPSTPVDASVTIPGPPPLGSPPEIPPQSAPTLPIATEIPAPPPTETPAPPPPPLAPTSKPIGSVGSTPPPAPPPRPASRAKTWLWPLVGLGLLVGLAFVAAAFFVVRQFGSAKEETPSPIVEAAPETGVVEGGRWVVDARPWGEVISLVDGEGQEVALPADRQTPLVLDLPPGRYTVLLTHPEVLEEPSSCEVEISARVGATCNVELLQVTPEDYWEDVGWDR